MADQVVTGQQVASTQQNPASVVKTTQNADTTQTTQTNAGAGGSTDLNIAPEISEWAKTKGFASFEEWAKTNPEAYRMATSYREAEKLIGGDKIPLPKDMNDAAALRTVFEKLGTPKDAKEYKLQVPQGQTEDFANAFRQAAHGANLTQKQAESLNTWWNGMVDGLLKADDAQRGERAAAEKIGLEKDWKGDFNTNQEVATRAALKLASDLGIPRDNLADRLEQAMGLRDAMRLLKYVGDLAQVRGDSFEGADHGSTRGGGSMAATPEQAKQVKADLMKDRATYQKYKAGDPETVRRFNELNAIIASETATANRTSTGNPRAA